MTQQETYISVRETIIAARSFGEDSADVSWTGFETGNGNVGFLWRENNLKTKFIAIAQENVGR